MASLTPSEIQYQLSHASGDRSASVIAAVTTCLCLATIAVGFRILARRMMKTPLGADDWMILTALVREYLHQLHTFEDTKIPSPHLQFFNAVYATSTLVLVRFGLGRHQITLEHPVSLAKSEISTEVLYNPAMITVKFFSTIAFSRVRSSSSSFGLLPLSSSAIPSPAPLSSSFNVYPSTQIGIQVLRPIA